MTERCRAPCGPPRVNARTGFDLVGIVDAALPVARITAEVLAQDSKDIPLLEEYVLRLVDQGERTPESIAGFLGLDVAMVNQPWRPSSRTSGPRLDRDEVTWRSYGGAKC
ncbi:hypothetical protein [Streptomyces sp. NPDC005283]|uniref:hypothetical protein n=1 Tax=Streptomyces sp. NPDC005283 TaxID=3156871 RepID=UPI0034514C8D